MLKALELVGFKSFADRTRFDFPDGITIVVGPNGSGKSNVVDAIKWVLGAQSAKALRGSEMTDVIFKGSAEGGRKPANSAEVTLILDNHSRLLSIDVDEVQVSRRVYRSGEGEYAINGQPCRLKDVRDVFRGTGVGVDAYSLIEQGKVDRLLQSSARDRRAIFEEAAGISRFKAKKADAERRLARVDQNMLRIRDIVEELGKRLATLKSQASKAQRYREWTSQITLKRTQLGLLDVRLLDNQAHDLDKRAAESETMRSELVQHIETSQHALQQHSIFFAELQNRLQGATQHVSECQRNHTQASGEWIVLRERQSEWNAQRSTLLERIELLERRVTVGEEEIQNRQLELDRMENEKNSARLAITDVEAKVQLQEQEFQNAKSELDRRRDELSQLRSRKSQLHGDVSSQSKELEQVAAAIVRISQEMEDRRLGIQDIEADLHRNNTELEAARHEFQLADDNKRIAKQAHQKTMDRQRVQHQSVLELQARIQGIQERLSFLSQLEEQFTSAGRGGQQLMRSAQSLAANSPSMISGVQSIRGMVADLVTTDLHLAPLVDVALGAYADAVVLADGQIVDWINEGRLTPEGRVTLLRMDRLPTRRTGEKIQLDGLRGVVGRADRLVRANSVNEPLVRALLGTTWFVESLATALDLSHFRGAGLRFVTAECQLVDSDGSITIGSLQTGLGLVSRRSEMQAAADQQHELQLAMDQARSVLETIDVELHAASDAARDAEDRVIDAARRMAAVEQCVQTKQHQLQHEVELLDSQQSEMQDRLRIRDELQNQLAELTERRIELEDAERQLTEEIESCVAQIGTCDVQLRAVQSQLVEQRIALARLEQRVDGTRVTVEQLLHDASERGTHVQIARHELSELIERIDSSEQSASELTQRIDTLHRELEEQERLRTEIAAALVAQQACVADATKQRDQWQRQIDKLQDRITAIQQEREHLESSRHELRLRYRDDYQIDLEHPEVLHANLGEDTPPIETWNRSEIESQLAYLRQEIASAGSVNMEALDELDALQLRYNRLAGQEQDLLDAKAGLIKTMMKIDEDSQDLFRETLETIRGNFQQLYRKSFGGGSADIVLENPEDPESGIEILATPPGKTTFNNSLLSGGEKALTAVSLIMAFFQYRPSPFCILDEVDAPFDEANIGRFVTVLNEFIDTTKFIVVTHSKKTMTVANMIYGVTMQESGVSRQVAVKFEEVNDRGEIIQRQTRRAA